MKFLKPVAFIALVLIATVNASYVDVIEGGVGYFCPDEEYTYASPYYRWFNENWSWQHNAIDLEDFSSATLSISAFDVDAASFPNPEIDEILVWSNQDAEWQSIGFLDGASDIYSYTTFNLDVQYLDEIKDGLRVMIDIDKGNNYNCWAVTLAKSVISIDGGTIPDPNPNTVPEPTTFALLTIGLLSITAANRKIK